MKNFKNLGLVLSLIMLATAFPPQLISEQPGVLPSDCVGVRYVQGLWLNPSGTLLAYLVKVPNLATNRNDSALYVRNSAVVRRSQGNLLLTAEDVADVIWLRNGGLIAALATFNGKRRIALIDVSNGSRQRSPVVPLGTDSFSIDAVGNTIAYSVLNKAQPSIRGLAENSAGYRVTYGEAVDSVRPTHSFYVMRRDQHGDWSKPELLAIRNPVTHVLEQNVIVNSHWSLLSLSPSGKQLLFQYMTPALPEGWHDDAIVKLYSVQNTLFEILVRYDIASKETTLAFPSISVSSVPVWSSDSANFFVNAYSPVGSSWAAADLRDHLAIGANANLFSVNIDSGRINQLVRHISLYHEPPHLSADDSDLTVHIAGREIARVHRDKDGWRESKRATVPAEEADRISAITSNGATTFVVSERVSTPQDIFVYSGDEQHMRPLTDLNPQIRSLHLASVKTVHWSVEGRYDMEGLLFMPPDYVPGRRYPLVIQTKRESGWFACDSGASHMPSFAPQPIASAGMMYLAAMSTGTDPGANGVQSKGGPIYPGGIAEPIQHMEMWDSAVVSLANEGLVNADKVGIIGFSRTGFEVEFDLAHARTHYAAATATDNVDYSLSGYWMLPYVTHADIAMFGGPPFGDTLSNWQQYSISFNLDKIEAPLLMEEMGYGVHDDDPNRVPITLVPAYEIYRGLVLRDKPVEMYYYPDEDHQPDHPWARLATIERNVDWYRFWLQDYEDPVASKAEQYRRWRKMKTLLKR